MIKRLASPAAVAAGNVETSQRIADVLLGALAQAAPDRVPAASQGTMNNVLVGNDDFAYYETVAGGQGARPGRDGQSGIQTGMTNTQNTPIEALHAHYPFRVLAYTLRRGSDEFFLQVQDRALLDVTDREARTKTIVFFADDAPEVELDHGAATRMGRGIYEFERLAAVGTGFELRYGAPGTLTVDGRRLTIDLVR